MSSFDSLGDNLIKLGDACIDSMMDILGFTGSTSSGFSGQDASYNAIYITPLGGSYQGSTFVGGGVVKDAQTNEPALWTVPGGQGWPFHDFPSLVDYFQSTINELFTDFWQIPFPSNYDSPLQAGRNASAAIALLPVAGREGFGKGSEPWGVEGFGSNEYMRQIDWISGEVGEYDGDAIEAFNKNYLSQLPLLATGQQYMTSLLWAAAGGQKEMWLRTRSAVGDIAAKAVEAAEAARGGGGGGLSTAVSILGAALSLGTIVVTGGTAGPVIAAGATITGVVSSFLPEDAEPPKPELGSDNPVGVLGNIKKALDEVRDQVAAEEGGQVKALENGHSFVTGNTPSFNFSPPELIGETSPDQVRDPGEIKVNTDTLRDIGNEDLPHVAHQFKISAGSLEQNGGSGLWHRPGNLGVGATGPWPQWTALAELMTGILDNTYEELYKASETLVVVANNFDKSDAVVQDALEAKDKELDNKKF